MDHKWTFEKNDIVELHVVDISGVNLVGQRRELFGTGTGPLPWDKHFGFFKDDMLAS